MNISLECWIAVFCFLYLNDFLRAARACFMWLCFIKRHRLLERDSENLDLPETGKLYCFIPQPCLNTSGKSWFPTNDAICSRFGKIRYFRCPSLDQIAIFQAKDYVRKPQQIAISGNNKFTILDTACLPSFPEIITTEAHGLQLKAEELLFLLKTFDCVAGGTLLSKMNDGYNLIHIMNTFERDLFEDESLF